MIFHLLHFVQRMFTVTDEPLCNLGQDHESDPAIYELVHKDYNETPEMKKAFMEFVRSKLHLLPPLVFSKADENDITSLTYKFRVCVIHYHLLIVDGFCFVQACSSGSLQPAYTALEIPIIISLFADDSAVYLPWSQQAFQVMQSLLDTFCNATSKINYEKSQVVPIGDISHLPEWIYQVGYEVMPPRQPIKYLGFWFGADVAPEQVWEAAVHSLNRRVTSWDDKLIMFEGRVILLRHILGAIPINTLSVSWATGKQYLQIRRQLTGLLWGLVLISLGGYWWRQSLRVWRLGDQRYSDKLEQAFYGKVIFRLLLQEQLI
ncbi:hypothetical protein R1sor_019301 [Riccia sorocarpa]|uniref:Uncharacterized protein n=1 Tax=Riccia sorocarpa TaxID=122646 RepID=A0ABD3IFG1_9MARC